MSSGVTFERDLRDRGAADYDDWYRRTKGVGFDQRERDVFRARAGDARRALDLGSGTGRITEVLPGIPHVVAVDFSGASLRQLVQKSLPNATPVLADATALPVRSDSCDLVVSCQVLTLLRPAQLTAALREAARVLRPGGRLVASFYNRDYWRDRSGPEPTDLADHLYMPRYSAEEIAAVARPAGFRALRSEVYKALPDRGRVPARLTELYGVIDRVICRAFGRRAGCYVLYEGVRAER